MTLELAEQNAAVFADLELGCRPLNIHSLETRIFYASQALSMLVR